MNDTFVAIPSIVFVSTIAIIFGPKIANATSHKVAVLIGCGLILTAQTCAAFITVWQVWLSIFIMCCGCAVGIGYIPALHCGWAYWPWFKGRVSGTVLCAFGFGAFIFSILGTAIVNPDNVKPSITEKYGAVSYHYFGPEIANRVPTMYLTFLSVYVVITLGAALCVHYPTKEELAEIELKNEEVKKERA